MGVLTCLPLAATRWAGNTFVPHVAVAVAVSGLYLLVCVPQTQLSQQGSAASFVRQHLDVASIRRQPARPGVDGVGKTEKEQESVLSEGGSKRHKISQKPKQTNKNIK